MNILPHLNSKSTLYLSQNIPLNCAYLHFGSEVCEVKVFPLSQLCENTLLLSADVIEQLHIPLGCDFQLLMQGNRLVLGPFIGILFKKTDAELKRMTHALKNYTYDYAGIGGCVCAFSLQGINRRTGLVSGYVYAPAQNKFVPATFPFPAAVFKRMGVKKAWREYLHKMTDGRVFNDRLMGKWKMYCLLLSCPDLAPYLPETALYEGPQTVHQMLRVWPELYIKHIYGSKGIGIIHLHKQSDWVMAEIMGSSEKLILKTSAQLTDFLHDQVSPKEYVIQRGVSLLMDGQSKVDFRAILVRNQNGEWEIPCNLGRFGAKGSIVSNVSSGGHAVMVDKTLMQLLNLTAEQAYLLNNQMEQLCKRIGAALYAMGWVCGNLGLDIALDTEGHLWIIEVNNRDPNHTIVLNAGSKRMFYEIKTQNMLYAKYLCGFGERSIHETTLY